MSEFKAVLRRRVDDGQQAVTTAWRAGNHDLARTHAGRLAELLDLAARHGIDTTGWVDPAVRSFAAQWS